MLGRCLLNDYQVLLYNILKEGGVASSFFTDYLVKKSGTSGTISVLALSCQQSASLNGIED
jgi:hypothetical protein